MPSYTECWQWAWSCNFSFIKTGAIISCLFSYQCAHYTLHALLPVDHLTTTGINGNSLCWEIITQKHWGELKQIHLGKLIIEFSKGEHTSATLKHWVFSKSNFYRHVGSSFNSTFNQIELGAEVSIDLGEKFRKKWNASFLQS